MLLKHATPNDPPAAPAEPCRDCATVLSGSRLSHPYLVLAKRAGPDGDNTYHCLICSSALRNNPNHLGCGWALSLVKPFSA